MNACANCQTPCRGRFCMARPCRAAMQRAKYRERNPELDAKPCANCGEPTTVAGRDVDRRYCMKKDCRKAKWRWDYNRRLADPDSTKMEKRPCSCCKRKLEARPWRVTDSDLGRWCRRAACQEDEARTFRLYESSRRYWQDEMKAVECPECHLDLGVRQGYVHPHRDGIVDRKVIPCTALGEVWPDEDLLVFAKRDWNVAREKLLV